MRVGSVTAAAAPALAGGPSGQPLIGHFQAFRKDRLRLLDACREAPEEVVQLRIGLLDVRAEATGGHQARVRHPPRRQAESW